jgi:hypothetical protein
LRQITRDDLHRGRFSGAIWAQEPEHLSFAGFKGNAIHRVLEAICFDKFGNFNGHLLDVLNDDCLWL